MPPSGKYGSAQSAGVSNININALALPSTIVHWIYNSTPSPGRLQINVAAIGTNAVNNVYPIYHDSTPYTFDSKKTYQFITHTVNLYAVHGSFSVLPPWPANQSDELKYYNGMSASNVAPTLNATQSFFHYSSPTSTLTTTSHITYKANGTFSSEGTANEGITDFVINELDFKLQGFSYYRVTANEEFPITSNSLGWYYNKNSDKYHWYDRVTGSASNSTQLNTGYFPVGGPNGNKIPDIGYRLNNALVKFVPYSYFNFSFSYQNQSDFPLKIYTSYSPPSQSPATFANLLSNTYTPPSGSVLIATLTQSVATSGATSLTASITHNFYGVRGNQYLIFVGGFAGASASGTTYSSTYLTNIRIDGGYYSGNNRQYLMSTGLTYSSPVIGLTGATYSALIGTGNTINATASLENPGISKIYSKIGNGKFTAGIWENGVWNTGWRVDDGMYEFHNVSQYFGYNKNKRWRLQITGPTSSVSNFNIGDNVSIGNIVAIDINEDRRLLKNYYTIINKTDDTIIVEFDNNFPLRRIKRDSDYHRIYVTKNVWLSGGFLNGYFKGIWSYGLFKGYPLITEMYDSHWIDGIFDGGHFSSSQYTVPDFIDTVFSSGYVGLLFATSSTPHGLAVGDLITIDKDNKNINPQYDGEHYVTEVVNPYQIKTDIDWGQDSKDETGSITIELSKGVVQKVKFKSNNISKVTSSNSLESDAVFVYNSWMDVLYDSSYASNIGKPQMLSNSLSRKSYSENNLHGYITNDVLESDSTFRDSYSSIVRSYKLGTKYTVFADFIGDAGKFENEFGGTYVSASIAPSGAYVQEVVSISGGENEFVKDGWTFSRMNVASLTFSRTTDIGSETLSGEELRVQAIASGGILDITPFSENEILNKTYEEVQRFRYTKVEFDLITYSSFLSNYDEFNLKGSVFNTHTPYTYKYIGSNNSLQSPPIHFNNLNFINKKAVISGVETTILTTATYLPIYDNVNHLLTPKRKKSEYFYNKRNLAMHFYGYGPVDTRTVEYIIDNLHFYEVDMIPFFQYFTEDNINKGIQVPYQGISPFIDYTNSNFSFVDNISIGLDSIQTQNSNTVVSGVGVGIGTSVGGGTIYQEQNQDYTVNYSVISAPVGSGGFSDIRLKENIVRVGRSLLGINIYEWNYINQINRFRGVIAQELLGTIFENSLSIKQGFYWVDYTSLDVKFEKI
jgi:hypothetical protein